MIFAHDTVLVVCTHVDDHADSGESSSQVLWVGRPHRHRDDPRIETAIEGSDQVNTCRSKRQEPDELKYTVTFSLYIKCKNKGRATIMRGVCTVCVCLPGG